MIKLAVTILILTGIALYLIVRASDETRSLKVEKNKTKISIFSLVKQNIHLLADKYRLQREINILEEINEDLISEHTDYLILKHRYEAVLRSVKLDLKHIQNLSNMTDKELIQERYILTERIIKDLENKIKELDSSENQSSSN